MKRSVVALAALAALVACDEGSGDPADGGFLAGVGGIAGGGYDQRIEERQSAVAAAEARGAALDAQLAQLNGELGSLKAQIVQQRAALRQQGVRLSAGSEAEVQRVIALEPNQADPSARAEALRRAIADARALSESLANLSG